MERTFCGECCGLNMNGNLELAQQYIAQGAFAKAATLLEPLLIGDAANHQARYFIGIALHGQERWREAVAQLDMVSPDHELRLASVLAANTCLQSLGEHDQVVERLVKMTQTVTQSAALQASLGLSYLMLGRDNDAIEQFEHAKTINSAFPGVRQNLATALRNVGRLDDAIKEITQVLTSNADDSNSRYLLATFMLEAGDAGKALTHAQISLEQNPYNRNTMALYAIALAEVGHHREALAFVGYDSLLQDSTLGEPPAPFGTLGEFHADLIEQLRASDTLSRGSASRTTKGGWHSGNLALDGTGSLRTLKEIIDVKAKAYFDQLVPGGTHPYYAWKPSTWHTSLWSVIFESQGHQTPHMHPDGWLSGVYYVRVPDTVSDVSGAGCLEFGRGREHWKTTSDALIKRIRPTEGKIVLFPSYYYHRTIPFESNEERICFAFDIRPIV